MAFQYRVPAKDEHSPYPPKTMADSKFFQISSVPTTPATFTRVATPMASPLPPPPKLVNTTVSEHKVSHHYHDHANDPDVDDGAQLRAAAGGGSGSEQSFPMKLHYMLNDIEKDGLSHIISWSSHGRCFVVHDQKLFVEKILCCWFRQSKIASFQRQLNIYGFQRLTKGPDKNGYYHELFLRGKPGLASLIQRQKLKGTKTRRAASPESEPNFYSMTPMPSNTPSIPPPAAAAAKAPMAWPASSALGSLASPRSDSLTLQKIVPSILSPVAFETTVHFVPQRPSMNQGLMVKSTCSLTLKSTSDDYRRNRAMSMSLLPLAPTPAALRQQRGQSLAMPSNVSTNNETFWAALGNEALAMALRDVADIHGGSIKPFGHQL